MQALSGVRVLEAAQLGAAPWIATWLGEYGAEVIKLESPQHGDALRTWGPQKDGIGLMWKSISRNKKCITVDLRKDAGRDLFRSLLIDTDILIMNFRTPTLKQWGLDYPDLREVNPALIVVHITGFGRTGPYSERPGFGTLIEAMSGYAHITGEADGPPTLPQFPLADSVAALAGVGSVMTALYHRDVHGGPGQLIDLSLLDPLCRLMEQTVIEYDQLGLVARRAGNRWGITVPRNAYRTRDNQWVALSGSAPALAERVFTAIGRSDLITAPGYSDPRGRLARADEIDQLISDWIAERSFVEVMETFVREEVAAAPIYSAPELLADPHVRTRETFVRIPDDELGDMLVSAPVARLSETPGAIQHLGRALGADTDEVLSNRLDLDRAALDQLRDSGVI